MEFMFLHFQFLPMDGLKDSFNATQSNNIQLY